jgi:glycosyltransferase involved in cell wall biosynthesis
MPNKNIAVLIPVYNNQSGLEKSILSIVGADKELVDIIVVDDGSLRPAYLDNLKDYNIKLLRYSPNMGIQCALNTGLEYILANGYAYTARLDTGDTIIVGRFAKQKSFLDSNQDYGIVGSWMQTVSSDGSYQFICKFPTIDKDIRNKMHLNNCFAHPSVLIRNDILTKTGPYSSKYKSAQDYDLFFRILQISKGSNLPEPLILYEVMNENAISYKRRYQQLRNRLRIQFCYFNPIILNSYIGVIKTIVTLFLSYKALHWIKVKIRNDKMQ